MKLFLQACGIEDHFQLCVEDRNRSESQQMVFQRPYVVIGRTPDADLTLDHWQVSRRHTYLQVVAGRLYCLDLGSRTGTHWEGPPSRWRWMTRGQAIHIGPYRISSDTLVDGDDDSTGGETPPPSSDELPRVALVPLDGREDPVILDEALSLMGRSPICRIRLSDPTLSKFHASLIRTRLGVWMVDLLGAGGITINRTRLRAARLNEGDEIGVGQQQFRVAYAQPDAYPTLFDEDVIEPVGSILARYEAPVNHNWLPNANAPSGPPGRDTGTGFVMGDPMNPRGTTGLPESVMIAQALLAPMLNQFASMQQQMFEQFHQSMMMMMQSMHMMHRERMDSVDKELEEVRRLTRELNALKAEAARLEAEEAAKAAARAAAAAAAPPTPQPAPAQGPSRATPPAGSPTRPTPTTQSPPANRPPSAAPAQPRPQPADAASRPPTAPPSPPRPPSAGVPPTGSPRPAPAQPKPGPAQPQATAAKPKVDVHSILQQRINNLQTERQTRWQKILGMVGAGGGESQ